MGVKLNKNKLLTYTWSERAVYDFVSMSEISNLSGLNFGSNSVNFMVGNVNIHTISSNYVEAVNNLYCETQKNYENFDALKRNRLTDFFWQFASEHETLDPQNGLNQLFEFPLVEARIEEYFMSVVLKRSSENIKSLLRNIALELILKIKNCIHGMSERFFSFVKSNHYHIFSDEEANLILNNFKISFSKVLNIRGEASINSFINFNQLKWQNIVYSYNT